MSNERKSIEEMTADTEKPVRDRKNWVAFVESDAVNFMTLNEMEKMTDKVPDQLYFQLYRQ